MRKTLILSTFLVLCFVWAGAQTSPSSGSAGSQTGSSSSSGSQTSGSMSQSSSDTGQTVQGCLSGSAGNFTLTSSSGTTYQLAGDTSKLSNHVGEEVEISGTPSSSSSSAYGSTSPSSSGSSSNPSGSSSTSPSGSAGSSTSGASGSAGASAGGGQTINVQHVRKIASSCSTGK